MKEYPIIERWVTPNKFSRPQLVLREIRGIVIHWVGVPNGRAIGVFNFFEGLKAGRVNPRTGRPDYASAHEAIDLDGSIHLLIPSNEVAYGAGAARYKTAATRALSGNPNSHTYHIECCHTGAGGEMTTETYDSLVKRCASLCRQWNLDPSNALWLHHEITGKNCHRWFVNNPTAWAAFKKEVSDVMGTAKQPTPQSQLEQWQLDIGLSALRELSDAGMVRRPETWETKLHEPVPNWLFFEMIRRLNARIGQGGVR